MLGRLGAMKAAVSEITFPAKRNIQHCCFPVAQESVNTACCSLLFAFGKETAWCGEGTGLNSVPALAPACTCCGTHTGLRSPRSLSPHPQSAPNRVDEVMARRVRVACLQRGLPSREVPLRRRLHLVGGLVSLSCSCGFTRPILSTEQVPPRGYVTFNSSEENPLEEGGLCYRDVTSPINDRDVESSSSSSRGTCAHPPPPALLGQGRSQV